MNPCRTDCPAGDCAGCVFPPSKAQEASHVTTDPTTQACMGGFCEHRKRCAAHIEFDRVHQEPSERKCQRGEEAPVATGRGITARDRILLALTAAGADGVAYCDLLRLAGAKAIAKALIAGRKDGLWCSNRRKNNLTRYYIDQADMQKAAAASRQEARELKRAKDDARKKAQRAALRALKRAKVAAPNPEKKPAPPKLQAAPKAPPKAAEPQRQAEANPEPRPTIIPPGLRVHHIPTPPSRYAVARVEPIFSGLPLGMYHPAESVLGRAYAQGGAL